MSFPKLDAADPIRVEALIIENTAKLPRDELKDGVLYLVSEHRNRPGTMDASGPTS